MTFTYDKETGEVSASNGMKPDKDGWYHIPIIMDKPPHWYLHFTDEDGNDQINDWEGDWEGDWDD